LHEMALTMTGLVASSMTIGGATHRVMREVMTRAIVAQERAYRLGRIDGGDGARVCFPTPLPQRLKSHWCEWGRETVSQGPVSAPNGRQSRGAERVEYFWSSRFRTEIQNSKNCVTAQVQASQAHGNGSYPTEVAQ
jgi:hypothetical protein